MKIQLLFLTLAVAVAIVIAAPKETYTTKFDGVDVDQILASSRLLNNYVKCLLETGSCTPDGRELKSVLSDALETDCAKCSETQRKGSDKVVRYLIKNKRDTWTKLATKYDPSGKYRLRHPEIFE